MDDDELREQQDDEPPKGKIVLFAEARPVWFALILGVIVGLFTALLMGWLWGAVFFALMSTVVWGGSSSRRS